LSLFVSKHASVYIILRVKCLNRIWQVLQKYKITRSFCRMPYSRYISGSEVSSIRKTTKQRFLFRLRHSHLTWENCLAKYNYPARPDAASGFAGKPRTRPRTHAKPKEDFVKVNRVHKRLHGELTSGSGCVPSHRLAQRRQLSLVRGRASGHAGHEMTSKK
jgi:hypothetical protein